MRRTQRLSLQLYAIVLFLVPGHVPHLHPRLPQDRAPLQQRRLGGDSRRAGRCRLRLNITADILYNDEEMIGRVFADTSLTYAWRPSSPDNGGSQSGDFV